MRSSNNELKIAKARLEEKHLLFAGQISKLENERSSNKALIEEKEKEIDSLKHKVDQQHSEAKSDYDSLKRDLDESVKALNNRRIEFSTKLAENDSMMQNIKHEAVVAQRDFENKIANLRQQLKEKDISRMAMNEAFENDMFELNKRLEKKDIEISELQKTYKTTHSHHTNLKLRVISQWIRQEIKSKIARQQSKRHSYNAKNTIDRTSK